MKARLVIATIICLTLIGCNRFKFEEEEKFNLTPEENFIAMFISFAQRYLTTPNSSDLEFLMHCYDPHYLNEGTDHSAIEDLYGQTWPSTAVIKVIKVNPPNGYQITIRDENFVVLQQWLDYVEGSAGVEYFRWVGNKQGNSAEFVANFTQFANAQLQQGSYEELLGYYSADYLCDAFNIYTGIEGFFRSHVWTSATQVTIDSIAFNQYTVGITDADMEAKVWQDNLVWQHGEFKWRGNGRADIAINSEQQFMEYFLTNASTYLAENDIDPLLRYYSPDYQNGDKDYDDIVAMYRGTIWSRNVQMFAWPNGISGWMILLMDDGFFNMWDDYVEKPAEKYMWMGKPLSEAGFIEAFVEATPALLVERNFDELLKYYWADYKNGTITYADMDAYYRSQEWSAEVAVSVTPIRKDRGSTAYSITISDPALDYHYTWVDYAEKPNNRFLWVGNQPEATPNQIVVVETFTGIYCQYCPLASDKLHHLSEIYPDEFIFIEYFSRANDPLGILEYNRFAREKTYYGVTSEPFAAFQGMVTFNGLGANNAFLNQYQPTLEGLIDDEATIVVKDLAFSIANDQIAGSVTLTINEPNNSNLYLFYVVYEEELPEETFYYYEDIPVVHAVRARGYRALENPISGGVQAFSLQIPAQTYPLETDTVLVVWVQRMQNGVTRVDGDKIFYAVKSGLY